MGSHISLLNADRHSGSNSELFIKTGCRIPLCLTTQMGSCRSFYKDCYDWPISNYLICITTGNILFKIKYLPELC